MAKQVDGVDEFMRKLEHPMKREIEAVRAIVKDADGRITERIKWNAPSFCYAGDDRVTFKLYPPERIQLVFHRGAKVKDGEPFSFTDDSGLLAWVASGRGLVTFENMEDVEAKAPALRELVRRWVQTTG